jgi:hypothetical protein
VREAIATVPVLIEEVAVAEIGDARAADLPETSERRRVGVCQQGRRAACEGEETLDVTKGFRESGRPGSNRRRPAWEAGTDTGTREALSSRNRRKKPGTVPVHCKTFVLPLEEVVRIRAGQTDSEAI